MIYRFLLLPCIWLLVCTSCGQADSTTDHRPLTPKPAFVASLSQGLQLTASYSWLNETEYLPFLKEDIYRSSERNLNVQLTQTLGRGYIGLGVIDGTLRQDNELFNDCDFSLQRKAPFVLLNWQWTDALSSRATLRFEEFRNNGHSGFYQLRSEESLWTGYGELNYRTENSWLTLSFSRDRDPEPIYDAINDRVELKITAEELSGIEVGWRWTPQWKTSLALYYEAYGSQRPDQLNYTAQIIHLPSWVQNLQAAVGVGYYTEEQDTIVNLTINYHRQWQQKIKVSLEYQVEHSDVEQSLLHQIQTEIRYQLSQHLAVIGLLEYGQESGDDHDDSLFASARLEYRIF